MVVQQKVEFVFGIKDQIGNKINDISKDFTSFGKNLDKQTKAFQNFSKVATVGLIGIAGVSVKFAGDFEKQMSNVNTLYSDNGESVEKLKDGVKELLKESPKDVNDLGGAVYDIVSAGITDTSEALEVLNASQKLAVAGLGETKDATNILTSALNAFGEQGLNAADVSNIFFKAVKNGKTTVAELSQGFGGVAGLAATLGVQFDELAAATSTLTTTGLPASEAYTSLKAAMSNILKPSKAAMDMAYELGIQFDSQALKAQGLKGFLDNLAIATDGNVDQMSAFFGSTEALNAILTLTGSSAETYTDIINDMKSPTDDLTTAFDKQNETFDAQFKILKNNLNVVMITLGEKILPTLNSVVMIVIQSIQSLSDWRGSLSGTTQNIIMIIGGLTTSIIIITGTISVLIPLVATATTIFTGFMTVLGLLITPIGLVITSIAGLYLAWETNLFGIRDLTDRIFGNDIQVIMEGFKLFFVSIKDSIVDAVHAISNIFDTLAKKTIDTYKTISKYNPMNVIGGLGEKAGGIISEKLGYRAGGGSVFSGSPYIVGEQGPELFIPNTSGNIIPNNKMGGGTTNININVGGNYYGDDKQFAEKIGDNIIKQLMQTYNFQLT